MKPNADIIKGDALERLLLMASASLDSCVTDPPSAIGFMNCEWDKDKGGRDQWIAWLAGIMRETRRVLKSGSHALVWALPRMSHWTAMALEDAGFEIRDVITHHFGQGFPKSMDVSKAIDKHFRADRREVIREGVKSSASPDRNTYASGLNAGFQKRELRAPVTAEAKKWEGWGTALKPASEHWILCRVPFTGTVAANVLEHGTGALNIDACRIGNGGQKSWSEPRGGIFGTYEDNGVGTLGESDKGRWPSNVVFTCYCEVAHEEGCPVRLLDEQSGTLQSGYMPATQQRKESLSRGGYGGSYGASPTQADTYGDSGGASRFYYVAKASKAERELNLQNRSARNVNDGRETSIDNPYQRGNTPRLNTHPTVKPIELMRYLVRLITPEGGTVIDPFCGSGTTGIAALREGFNFIGIEQDGGHVEIARQRIAGALRTTPLFDISASSLTTQETQP